MAILSRAFSRSPRLFAAAVFAHYVSLALADDSIDPNFSGVLYTFDYITNWGKTTPNWLNDNGFWGLLIEKHPPCQHWIDVAYNNASPHVQITMQMATTLITLLPTLLTIGNWNQAKSSEVFSTSTLVGIGTAAFSFALPAKTQTGVKIEQRLELSRLPQDDVRRLRQFGERIKDPKGKPFFLNRVLSLSGLRITHNDLGSHDAEHEIEIEELRSWSAGTHGNLQFRSFSDTVEAFRNRDRLWGIPRQFWWIVPLLIFCTQFMLLVIIGLPPTFFVFVGWPIYDCTTQAVAWWLLASVAVSVTFKFVSWELSQHEIVKLHILTEQECARISAKFFRSNIQTVKTGIPPLLITYINPFKIAYRRLRPYFSWLWFMLSNIFSEGLHFLTAGRRKPVTVMVHLSEEARSPFPQFVSGFVQSSILLILTFFFGSFWAGTLFWTMVYLTFVLITVFLGRILGVLYVIWSTGANAFTVVNCQSPDEVRGVLRILTTTPNVMVEVNQRFYVDGCRIDQEPGFDDWIRHWEHTIHRSTTFDSAHLSRSSGTDLEKRDHAASAPALEKPNISPRVSTTEDDEEDAGTAEHNSKQRTHRPTSSWAASTHDEIVEAARKSISDSIHRPRAGTLQSEHSKEGTPGVPPTPSLPGTASVSASPEKMTRAEDGGATGSAAGTESAEVLNVDQQQQQIGHVNEAGRASPAYHAM